MKSSKRAATGYLSARCLLALALIAGLALINYFVLRAEIRAGASSGAVLNLGGQQRTLLQRAVVLATEFVTAGEETERKRLRRELLQTAGQIELGHHRLLKFGSVSSQNGGPRSKVEQIYYNTPWLLDTEVRTFVAHTRTLADSEPDELSLQAPSLRFIRDIALSNQVADALNEVVATYQRQIETKTARLRRLAYWSIISTFVVLVLTGLFVFHPMVRRVREDVRLLEGLNDTLEQRVSERTRLAEQRAAALGRSQAALHSKTRILRSILDSMGDGVIVTDNTGHMELINPAGRRLLNVTEETELPTAWTDSWTQRRGVTLQLPDKRTPYPTEELFYFAPGRGDAVDRAEVFVRRQTAPREIWLSVTARPVVDDDGEVFGSVALLRDITHRKQTEQELRDSETLYHSLVDNLPVCVVRKALDGKFLFANKLFCELIGRPLPEVVGKTDSDFYPRPLAEKYQADDRRVVDKREVLEAVEEHVTPRGRQMYVELRKAPVCDSDGQVIGTQTLFWDVTARRQAEQEREAMQKRLLQSERLAAIGEMVTGVAHESRNALQKIQACTQMLAWELNGNDGEAHGLVKDIQDAQGQLHRVLDNLRSYASPLKLQPRHTNVHTVLVQAWESALPHADAQEAVLQAEPEDVDVSCCADPFRLEQAFRNILENALNACGASAEIDVGYSEAVLHGQPALRISIHDNGPGIDPECELRMFEPFFTTRTQGTGLGTAIAKRLAEAHGGCIEIGREFASGAQIVITLPRGPL